MSPERITRQMKCGIWLPGDAVQMRRAFVEPSGRWLRVCHLSTMSSIVAGWDVASERSA